MKIFCTKLKPMLEIVSLSIVAAIMALVVSLTSVGKLYFGHALRQVPIYSVDTSEKKVALTFDAAWGSDKTLKIVNILKDAGLEATFFLVGFWSKANEDKIKQIDEAGFDIGTHSNTHPKMSTLSKEQMRHELEESIKLITNITKKPVKFFRAPFGDYSDAVLEVAGSLGLKTIQWDVDTLDWKGLSAGEILSRVKSGVKNGSIILCHNNSDHIVEALPLIISYLKGENYQIVKLSELVYDDGYHIDANGTQKLN